jgi:hypothetical protein
MVESTAAAAQKLEELKIGTSTPITKAKDIKELGEIELIVNKYTKNLTSPFIN